MVNKFAKLNVDIDILYIWKNASISDTIKIFKLWKAL